MRYIKLYENYIPNSEISELSSDIKNLIQTHYAPNLTYNPEVQNRFLRDDDLGDEDVPFTSAGKKAGRNYSVIVSASNSKFGIIYEVGLVSDLPSYYKDLNDEIKQPTFSLDIANMINEYQQTKTGENYKTTLYGYKWFGVKVMANKNRELSETEDLISSGKFSQTLDETKEDLIYHMYDPITFWFLCEKVKPLLK